MAGLNDRLASTIQFVRLDAKDDRHGSPAMREATVRQAVEEASTIDFREVIEPKPVIRALAVAAGVRLRGAVLLSGRASDVADRDEAVVRSLRAHELAASDASGSGRGPNHPQGGSRGFVHACRSRFVPATRCRSRPRRLTISPTVKSLVSRSGPSRGASSGDGSRRSISRSVSRSPPATIPHRSAMSPSRSFLLPP